ncbi:MAG: ATP-dependent DNA helicase RecG [Lachnospiraceae bacterium]|nr:ATP-dependent DNA helicase RecG [Lachnospiraceae bacterium]
MLTNGNTPVEELKGVGPKTASYFHNMNILTTYDLLRHFPRTYLVFGGLKKISELKDGEIAAVRVKVDSVGSLRRVKNKMTILPVEVSDESGHMCIKYFNMPFMAKALRCGAYYVFRGRVKASGREYTLVQPRKYAYDEYAELSGMYQSIYPLSKGLKNSQVVKAVRSALDKADFTDDYLSEEIRERYDLADSRNAYRYIHFPESEEQAAKGRRRFAFDELFFFIIYLRKNKDLITDSPNTCPMIESAEVSRFLEKLPFRLTKGQSKAVKDMLSDMCGPSMMNRLIQGDVGSGKTIVALTGLLNAVACGYQGALMAPTEVLASQHFNTVSDLVRKYDLPFKPALLTGSVSASAKKKIYESIASGETNLIIGTHALIQDKVEYKNLGLVVTDEQHRFGVRQRETLAKKGIGPHVLVMSATPIPRTLAIVLYGDLSVSTIKDMPEGRSPIKSCVVGESYRPSAYKFIKDEIAKGHQIYIICPMVEFTDEEDDDPELKNVVGYSEQLKEELGDRYRISYLHGRMRPADKDNILTEFAAGSIDILISTTVIEVGINVPNATVMMVENSERFGLSQLHQLRGRVGRGSAQGYAIFMSAKTDDKTKERLDILGKTCDGFEIASYDLKTRGPGELFGVRQSGDFAFRVADVFADADLLNAASELADAILKEDRHLKDDKNKLIKEEAELFGRNNLDFRTI